MTLECSLVGILNLKVQHCMCVPVHLVKSLCCVLSLLHGRAIAGHPLLEWC